MSTPRKTLALVSGLACAIALTGCIKNPDAPTATHSSQSSRTTGNIGEPNSPKPDTPAAEHPRGVQRTPQAALAAFAQTYANWSYRTLTAEQKTLAAISVGAARLAEQQAVATSASDSTIARAQVWNHGELIGISPDRTRQGRWVLVTREQTGGSSDYQGLPATYHVTLAELAPVPSGYAVSEWLPQN